MLFDTFCTFENPLQRVGRADAEVLRFQLLSTQAGLCYLSHFMHAAHPCPDVISPHSTKKSFKEHLLLLPTKIRMRFFKNVFAFPKSGIRVGYSIRPRTEHPGTVKDRCGGMDVMMLTRDPYKDLDFQVWAVYDNRASLDSEKDHVIVSACTLRNVYGLAKDAEFREEIMESFYGQSAFVFTGLDDFIDRFGWFAQSRGENVKSVALLWRSKYDVNAG